MAMWLAALEAKDAREIANALMDAANKTEPAKS